jgi:hypothetical protein
LLASPKDALLAESGYHTLFEWSAGTGRIVEWIAAQAEREAAFTGVSDAGVLDLFCFVERWESNRMSPERFEALRDRVARVAAGYDHVLVTAARLVGGPAPWRFRNRAHTLQHHRLLDALLRELVAPGRVHPLPDGEAPAVVEAALASLR